MVNAVSDYYKLECTIRELKEKLEKIKDKADMWDGKESLYYGNKLKEILKENE